jgi:hypothetical protein
MMYLIMNLIFKHGTSRNFNYLFTCLLFKIKRNVIWWWGRMNRLGTKTSKRSYMKRYNYVWEVVITNLIKYMSSVVEICCAFFGKKLTEDTWKW